MMIQYKLQKGYMDEITAVTIIGENISIPFAPDNTDYANFKKDLANGAELQDSEGNVIDGIAYLEELV
jgi:hypothetical protein